MPGKKVKPLEPPGVARALPAATPAEDAADAVVGVLQRAGYEAYRVGGAVRDRLLERRVRDVDVATSAVPAAVQALFPRTYAVGEAFGVIVVHAAEGIDVEVATFRAETGYADGRHPDRVRFSTAAEDARRRDFTINALYYDPAAQRILDFTGGLDDLRHGVVRAIGTPADRFAEDSLRLLRAVRFAAELRFELDPATAAAMPPLAGSLVRVSAERVYAELCRMLTGRDPARALRLLRELGLLAVWLPEVAALAGTPQPPAYHPEGDVWQHTLLMVDWLRGADATLAWAALLHDVGKPPTLDVRDGQERFPCHARAGASMAAAVLERLRAPARVRDAVSDMVANHMAFADVPRMRPATLRRLLARPTFAAELELHRLDVMASHRTTGSYVLLLDALAALAAEPAVPPPLLRGRDLLALGVPPGPRMGGLLRAVQERQLDGELRTAAEAEAWVRARLAAVTEGCAAPAPERDDGCHAHE